MGLIKSDEPKILIADSVGVGKTIEAGLIIKELEARNELDNILIICPKPLVAERKWELEMRRFDEDFIPLDGAILRQAISDTHRDEEWPVRYNKAIIPYSILDGRVYEGEEHRRGRQFGLLDLDPAPHFDLVIIDEAHHIRNGSLDKDKAYAYKCVRYFCEHADAVVMLTATPLQTSDDDLFTLMNLLRPDVIMDKDVFRMMSRPNEFIYRCSHAIRGAGEGWQEVAIAELTNIKSTQWGENVIAKNPLYADIIGRLEKPEITREERVKLVSDVESLHSFNTMLNRTRRKDNLRRESRRIDIQVISPLIPDGNDHARIHTAMLPGALGQTLYLSGHVVLCSEHDKQPTICELQPFAETTFCVAFAFDSHSEEAARRKIKSAFDLTNPFESNEQFFNAWILRQAPQLRCENMELLRLYYYRWFLIFKNAFTPVDVVPEHFLKTSCVYESCFGGWFGAPVGLSVPLQIMECAWMQEETLGRNQIDQWVMGKGNYREYIQNTPYAVWLFFQHHPDVQWLEACYPALLDYSLVKIEHGLSVTNGSWPTGAEYQPNFYQHTTPPWNWHHDVEGVHEGLTDQPSQVYRLDEAVFAILNIRACLNMATMLKRAEDKTQLERIEQELLCELHNRHWNHQLQMYVSVDKRTGKQCDQALCYDSFLTFLLGDALNNRMQTVNLLFEPNRFREEFASSTTDKQCPMYWPGNCLTGPYDASSQHPHFYPCSWNGPVWPYACTWITQSLGEAAQKHPELRSQWLAYFASWSELHFLYGDRKAVSAILRSVGEACPSYPR